MVPGGTGTKAGGIEVRGDSGEGDSLGGAGCGGGQTQHIKKGVTVAANTTTVICGLLYPP